MSQDDHEVVVPVIEEQVRADVQPVHTGSVRITKSLETHEELLEQELRRGRAEVRRIQTNRRVDGPQPPQRAGNTLIIPIVSEVLQGCEKAWFVTEEVHVTQLEESETIRQSVPVSREHALVEHLDAQGNVISTQESAPIADTPTNTEVRPMTSRPILKRETESEAAPLETGEATKDAPGRVFSSSRSILRKRLPKEDPTR